MDRMKIGVWYWVIMVPLVMAYWFCVYQCVRITTERLRLEYHKDDLECPKNQQRHSKPHYFFGKLYEGICLFRDFFALGFRFLREK